MSSYLQTLFFFGIFSVSGRVELAGSEHDFLVSIQGRTLSDPPSGFKLVVVSSVAVAWRDVNTISSSSVVVKRVKTLGTALDRY